jgi:hypothetical protein
LFFVVVDDFFLFLFLSRSTHEHIALIDGDVPSTPESEALATSLANPPTGAGILLVGSPEARDIALERVTRSRWFVISINLTPEGVNKVSDSIQDLSNQIGFVPSFNQLSRMFEYFQSMIPGTKGST